MNERELADAWYSRVVWTQHGHYVAALHFTRRHRLLGGLTVLFTAAVGTSAFATISKQVDLSALTGALSVLAALLAALQTFLSYGERADKHRVAGASYGVVGRSFELLLARPELNHENLEKLKERLDALALECPHIPDEVHKRMKKNPPDRLPFEHRDARVAG
jgi:hypothetical protein